jgi:hypothetical protein
MRNRPKEGLIFRAGGAMKTMLRRNKSGSP